MELNISKYNLKLKKAFTISRRSFNSQDNIIVKLSYKGHTGYGEATSNPFYPNTKISILEKKLLGLTSFLKDYPFETPAQLWDEVFPMLKDYPFALCALDVAAHDLYGRVEGKALHEIWGIEKEPKIHTSYTISLGTPDEMKNGIKAMPWPSYKLKLGRPNDLETLHELRSFTRVPFRIDVNCGWTFQQAIEIMPALKGLGIEFVEQPISVDQWKEMKDLYDSTDMVFIADESCCIMEDIEKCVGHFDGVNIKLMKSGGITPALQMIQKARSLNLKVMVGCMTESTVGLSAVAQMINLLDYADVDGALFLKEDIATGVNVKFEKIFLPNGPGTGVQLFP